LARAKRIIEKQQKERLIKNDLGCEANLFHSKTKVKEGKKYFKVDIGSSGRYMVDLEGNIFGIKAYGVVHKGHRFGNLDTINYYYWGEYRAYKIK